jgi:hypothetical protein
LELWLVEFVHGEDLANFAEVYPGAPRSPHGLLYLNLISGSYFGVRVYATNAKPFPSKTNRGLSRDKTTS